MLIKKMNLSVVSVSCQCQLSVLCILNLLIVCISYLRYRRRYAYRVCTFMSIYICIYHIYAYCMHIIIYMHMDDTCGITYTPSTFMYSCKQLGVGTCMYMHDDVMHTVQLLNRNMHAYA